MLVACVAVILIVTPPGMAAPRISDDTPTPAIALYLPWIASDFVGLPTATPTETSTPTPTATATATPTLAPPCPLPAERASAIAVTVSPNRASALEQMIGRAPFSVNLSAAVSGGIAPYSYCWDVEPDGHFDALTADLTVTLLHPGVLNPLLVVFDAQGQGQYVGTPPASSPRLGGKP
jgi:hypothetical protein